MKSDILPEDFNSSDFPDAMPPKQFPASTEQLILDLRESIDDKMENINSSVNRVNDRIDRVHDRIDKVNEAVGGHDGIRERLTSVETKMEEWENTPPGSYSIKAPKKTLKDHAAASVAPAGIMTIVVMVLEIVKAITGVK